MMNLVWKVKNSFWFKNAKKRKNANFLEKNKKLVPFFDSNMVNYEHNQANHEKGRKQTKEFRSFQIRSAYLKVVVFRSLYRVNRIKGIYHNLLGSFDFGSTKWTAGSFRILI